MENKNTFLSETPNGTVFSVKLVPNSSVNKIVDYTNEYVRIKISAPAIENKANKELISFCSDLFEVNKSKISIISGEKSKLKKVLIKDTKLDELTQKIMFMLNSVQKSN
ncbi:YggU family protein [bacterium]|nr:YggU family protein [bacterium]